MAHVLRRFGSLAIAFALFAVSSTPRADPTGSRPESEERATRIEAGLPAVTHGERTRQQSLHDWMRALAVPGLSIAVIDDYRIVWTRAYGVTTPGPQGTPVTPTTMFQAASIAKPVTALAVLHHAELGQLDLDADINDYLQSWKLPNDPIQAGEKVSLGRLLAHTGGVTPGGFAGYEPGAVMPDIVAVLGGVAPASNAPARAVAKPGSEVAYSGLGYSLLQLALTDRLHQPFEQIVQDAVLRPLGMRDSTFEQSLPAALAARAARGHLGVGAAVEGGWRLYPELAAAGLWTTATDLGKFIIAVAKSKRGKADLGFVVREDGAHGHFAHSGGNHGYFAHVEMLADTGQGIVIMSNSDAGQALASLVIAGVATEYDWPLPERRQVQGARAERLFAQLDRVANQRVKIAVDPEVLARYVGKYELAKDLLFDITLVDGGLRLRLGDQPQFPLFAESPTKFFLDEVDAQISFVVDASGTPSGLVLHQGGRDQQAARIE